MTEERTTTLPFSHSSVTWTFLQLPCYAWSRVTVRWKITHRNFYILLAWLITLITRSVFFATQAWVSSRRRFSGRSQEPEPRESSDYGHEPATPHMPKGMLVEIKGLEGSPAAEGKLLLVTWPYIKELMDVFQEDLIDWFGEVALSSPKPPESPMSPVSLLVPSSSPVSPESLLIPSSSTVSPKLPVTRKIPPSLPLPPPLLKPARSSVLSLLVPVSPSVHPQLTPSMHSDPPQDCQPPATPRREDHPSPPPVSKSWTPPRSFDPPVSTLAPSS